MSRRDPLARVHAGLAPAELARLVIAALARGDEREAGRLCAVAPRCAWTGPVAAYCEVFDAAEHAMRLGLVAAALSDPVGVLDALVEVLDLAIARLGDAAGVELDQFARECGLDAREVEEALAARVRPHKTAATLLREAVAEARAKLARQAASAWALFDRCASERVGVEPALLARAFLPPGLACPAGLDGMDPDWVEVDEAPALLDAPRGGDERRASSTSRPALAGGSWHGETQPDQRAR